MLTSLQPFIMPPAASIGAEVTNMSSAPYGPSTKRNNILVRMTLLVPLVNCDNVANCATMLWGTAWSLVLILMLAPSNEIFALN